MRVAATNMHQNSVQHLDNVGERITALNGVSPRKSSEKLSDSEDEGTPFYVGTIEDGESTSAYEWIVYLDVNGTEVPLKLATSAQVKILPMKDFYRQTFTDNNRRKVRDKKLNLRTYDDKPIPTYGVCRVILSNNGQKVKALFVLEGKQTSHTGAGRL